MLGGPSFNRPKSVLQSYSAQRPQQSTYHSIRNAALAPLELTESDQLSSSNDQVAIAKPIALIKPIPGRGVRSSINQPSKLPSILPPKLNSLSSTLQKPHKKELDIIEVKPFMELGCKTIYYLEQGLAQRPVTPPYKMEKEGESPGIILIPARRIFSDNIPKLQKLPQFPHTSDSQFGKIFEESVSQCNYIFDFSSPNLSVENKDSKSRALCELVQFFEQSIEVRKLTLDQQNIVFHMLYKNIFEQTPIFPSTVLSFDYTATIVDSSWPHLFYCYQILNRFVQIFPEHPMLTLDLIKKSMRLISIPDNNERLQILAFFRSYYDSRSTERGAMLVLAKTQLIEFLDGIWPPYCVAPLLVFLAHIFSRSGRNPSPEFLRTMRQAVFPLVNTKLFYLFVSNIKTLLTYVLIENSPLIMELYNFLIHHWTCNEYRNHAARLDLLIFLASKMDVEKIPYKQILHYISEGMISNSMKVAASAFTIFGKPKLDLWVEEYSKHVITILYDNVKKCLDNHWSKEIKDLASQGLAEMGKLNRNAFLKCRNAKGSSDSRVRRFEIEKNAMKNWAKVAKSALVETDPELRAKIKEIKAVFDFKAQEAAENISLNIKRG